MIKIGILGAETLAAGELIRILINHPDVEIKTVASPSEAGRRVDEIHRGLTGDTDLTVTTTLNPEGHDAVFLCGEPWIATQWMQTNEGNQALEELRIIDLTGAFHDGTHNMVYGFPEHNRKALVRGATRTSIPSPAAIAVETALFPLAKNGLLSSSATANIRLAATENFKKPVPENSDVITSTRLDPIAPIENRPDSDAIAAEITSAMRAIQPSFAGNVQLTLSRDGALPRGITAVVHTPCSVTLNELERLFDEAYSDHSFTYNIATTPTVADVANTNKCLLNLSYTTTPASDMPQLRITAVIDNLLKGSAGNAVHCLNLLFGLSERTGLALKASAF